MEHWLVDQPRCLRNLQKGVKIWFIFRPQSPQQQLAQKEVRHSFCPIICCGAPNSCSFKTETTLQINILNISAPSKHLQKYFHNFEPRTGSIPSGWKDNITFLIGILISLSQKFNVIDRHQNSKTNTKYLMGKL